MTGPGEAGDLLEPRRGDAGVNGGAPVGAGQRAVPHRVLADLATSLWRLQARLTGPGGAVGPAGAGTPGPDGRPCDDQRAHRHLEAAFDALADAGIEVQGHDGDPFDPGQSITAVAFEPDGTLEREHVVETVRPSVYAGGDIIQRGEVIVGTPGARNASGEDGGGEDQGAREDEA